MVKLLLAGTLIPGLLSYDFVFRNELTDYQHVSEQVLRFWPNHSFRSSSLAQIPLAGVKTVKAVKTTAAELLSPCCVRNPAAHSTSQLMIKFLR